MGRWWLLAAMCGALVACDSADDPAKATDVAGPSVQDSDTDVGLELPDVPHFSTVTPDGLVEGEDAGGTPDAAAALCPSKGELGCSCDGPSDCLSGYCVPSRDGAVCTKLCVDDCPSGWGCKQDLGSKPDVKFVCIPLDLLLCAPCDTGADCSDAAYGLEGVCVPRGDDGAFCATKCAGDVPCPGGFECKTTTGADGKVRDLCVPAAGVCGCSAYAEATGATTACARQSEAGVCGGVRRCTDGALTECDAAEPQGETCNGKDDDCDGETDEGLDGAACSEANEWGTCEGTLSCQGGKAVCDASKPGEETCNGKDDDCDGATDEENASSCELFWRDEDDDGFGKTGDSACLCKAKAPYTAAETGDCDDASAAVHPQATEACNGVDDNCNGAKDEGQDQEGCTPFYADTDGDSYGVGVPQCLCKKAAPYTAEAAGDCNDADGAAHPGAQETCDGKDNDCDGAIDEEGAQGCQDHYTDEDDDDHGTLPKKCLCTPEGVFKAKKGDDCYDQSALAMPGQTGWFTEDRGDGSFDYDCDGAEKQHWEDIAECKVGCVGTPGWATDGTEPAGCGVKATWSEACYFNAWECTAFVCCYPEEDRVQECR